MSGNNKSSANKIFIKSDETFVDICIAEAFLIENPTFREKRFKGRDSGETYRIINFWGTSGLLNDSKDDNKEWKWRTFSVCDLVYIAVLRQLREFGYPIKKLQNTKQSLYSPIFQNSTSENPITVLETSVAFAHSIREYGNSYLIIDSDGVAYFTTMNDYTINKKASLLPAAHILLNVNQLIHEKMNPKVLIRPDNLEVVTPGEKKIFGDIRLDSEMNSMTVKLQNSQPSMLEKEYNASVNPEVGREYEINLKEIGGLHNVIEKFGFGMIKNGIFRNGSLERITIIKQEKVSNAD